ncbi:MAG: response regulator transcription factor [Oscillospiraceae bacterium]|jgi:DNA-binding response OmpR family regulator|nr:response regulator transcription factor [Oscillospiraceae bacterium]
MESNRNGQTILVTDDERVFLKGIKFNLENDGYTVLTAADGSSAVDIVRKTPVDLVIMDLMMPNTNGLEATKQIRKFSNVPILILTAMSEDRDKLRGFDRGADDYLTKPFNLQELKARIKALLRRAAASAADASSAAEISGTVEVGHITIDFNRRQVFNRGVPIELATREFDLLAAFVRKPGVIFTREDLMRDVWLNNSEDSNTYIAAADIRTVDVHIRRLREKIELDPAHPKMIMTRWKIGYYFEA